MKNNNEIKKSEFVSQNTISSPPEMDINDFLYEMSKLGKVELKKMESEIHHSMLNRLVQWFPAGRLINHADAFLLEDSMTEYAGFTGESDIPVFFSHKIKNLLETEIDPYAFEEWPCNEFNFDYDYIYSYSDLVFQLVDRFYGELCEKSFDALQKKFPSEIAQYITSQQLQASPCSRKHIYNHEDFHDDIFDDYPLDQIVFEDLIKQCFPSFEKTLAEIILEHRYLPSKDIHTSISDYVSSVLPGNSTEFNTILKDCLHDSCFTKKKNSIPNQAERIQILKNAFHKFCLNVLAEKISQSLLLQKAIDTQNQDFVEATLFFFLERPDLLLFDLLETTNSHQSLCVWLNLIKPSSRNVSDQLNILESKIQPPTKLDSKQVHFLIQSWKQKDGIISQAAVSLEKNRKGKISLLDHMPEQFEDFFPAARALSRTFIVHVGPTNSGKTHDAMQELKHARHGVYLAPLRLLAYENYCRLKEEGIPVQLITGEEEIRCENAAVTCSTCEMADLQDEYDIAVIDEAQMTADRQRGGAWTQAILGLCAHTIHICCAPEAENLIQTMINRCQDSYKIIRHERFTPLLASRQSSLVILPGDARIVFSRRSVHSLAASLMSQGYRVSMIYGAMPYLVRESEAEKFRTGKTDVLVATDAIGMGLNLPISRIVFDETQKFDGKRKRDLNPDEFLQIAGRAGRYGLQEAGYVSGMHKISRKLARKPNDLQQAVIGFPSVLSQIDLNPLTALKLWQKQSFHSACYIKQDMEHVIARAKYLNPLCSDTAKIWKLLALTFDEKNNTLLSLWQKLAKSAIQQKPLSLSVELKYYLHPQKISQSLQSLEEDFKKLDLWYQFFRSFGSRDQMEEVLTCKYNLSEQMMKYLETHLPEVRRCSQCGNPLSWNYPYGMCENCYQRQRNQYRYDFWYDDDPDLDDW